MRPGPAVSIMVGPYARSIHHLESVPIFRRSSGKSSSLYRCSSTMVNMRLLVPPPKDACLMRRSNTTRSPGTVSRAPAGMSLPATPSASSVVNSFMLGIMSLSVPAKLSPLVWLPGITRRHPVSFVTSSR